MVFASFYPGTELLATTPSNSFKSRALRHVILGAVKGDTVTMFDNRKDLAQGLERDRAIARPAFFHFSKQGRTSIS